MKLKRSGHEEPGREVGQFRFDVRINLRYRGVFDNIAFLFCLQSSLKQRYAENKQKNHLNLFTSI